MATDTWYVRVRGKIAGPYSLDQLQSLRKRNQLGRAHEISVDGKAWETAGTLLELFPEVIKPTVHHPSPNVESMADLEIEPIADLGEPTADLKIEPIANLGEPTVVPPQTSSTQPLWYYANHGQQTGPISDSDLTRLVNNGLVRAETLVWRDGMQDWLPAQSVPGLIGEHQTSNVQGLSSSLTQPHTYSKQGYTQQRQVEQHRGELILTLGIIGLFISFVGIAAWIMGSSDLKKINRGAMDPTGKDKTKTGMILGIVATALMVIGIVIGVAIFNFIDLPVL